MLERKHNILSYIDYAERQQKLRKDKRAVSKISDKVHQWEIFFSSGNFIS